MKRISYLFIFIFSVFILSCKKEKDEPAPVETIESLLCTGTWIEDYTVNTEYDSKELYEDKSSDIPDRIIRKNAVNGLQVTFYKDSKTKLIPRGYTNPIESTWGYNPNMKILFTNATINIGVGAISVFPAGRIEVNKDELIVEQLVYFYVNFVTGIRTKISSEIHFKH